MAKKISDLALVASVTATDSFEVLQSGVSKRAPLNVPWTFGALLTASAGLTVSSGNLTVSAGAIESPVSLVIGTTTANTLIFKTDNTNRWQVGIAGNFNASLDNTYDLGAAGVLRPRTGYFGTSVITPVVGTGAASNLLLTTSGGTQVTVAHIASAVNSISLQGAAAGNDPILQSIGSDTDIGLIFSSKGADPLRFLTGSATVEQARIVHVAAAVNRLEVGGAATGSGPLISAVGSDTNIPLNVATKGTGAFNLFGAGVQQFQVLSTTAATNYIQTAGVATGGRPALQAVGTDTNVGLNLSSQGTGSVQIMTGLGARIGLEVLDTASAVNWLRATGAATGSVPMISVTGSDASVALNFGTKNTGAFSFYTDVLVTPAQQVSILHTASSNRYITLTGSNAGNPTISTSAGSLAVTPDLTLASTLTFTTAASRIIPGATSLALRNNANSADNLLISDAGAVTVRDDLSVSGDAIASASATFNLLNATVTTINFGGGATSAINFGNISGDLIFAGATIAINSQSAAYTLVAADANKCILHPTADNNARTFTIPANASVAYRIGTAVTFVNQINTVTIAITTDTLTFAGTGTTGSRTLAAHGVATAIKVTSTLWYISGTGLT